MNEGGEQRRLAAILAADMVGYTRHLEQDTDGTVAAWKAARADVIDPTISDHSGRIVKHTGDGFLAEFVTVQAAVECAVALQTGLAASPLDFRIGVNLGDIVDDGEDIHGEGVNIAARIEALADPGGISLSGAAYEQVRNRVDHRFEDIGEHQVKHVSAPVSVWRWAAEGAEPSVDVSEPIPGFDGRPAIAVLAFENMSGDPEQEYFADGIAEDILTRLARWRWLPVIARNSSFTFKGQNVNITEIGRLLGARYVLEGSVRKAGNRVRITGQLIDAESSHHVWADRYDRNLDDIFELQDEITEAIVAALEPAVGQAEIMRARRLTASDLGAWDTTQKALWYLHKYTAEDWDVGLGLLKSVLDQKADFAPALSLAAVICASQGLFGWTDDPAAAFLQARRYAVAAVASEPLNPRANMALGVAQVYLHQHEAALVSVNRAVELDPSFATGYYQLAIVSMFNGQPEAAIAAAEQAIRLSPFDTNRSSWLTTKATSHYMAREYDLALAAADEAIQTGTRFPLAFRARANSLAQLNRLDEAREALDEFMRLMPHYTYAGARQGTPFRQEADFRHFMAGQCKAGLAAE